MGSIVFDNMEFLHCASTTLRRECLTSNGEKSWDCAYLAAGLNVYEEDLDSLARSISRELMSSSDAKSDVATHTLSAVSKKLDLLPKRYVSSTTSASWKISAIATICDHIIATREAALLPPTRRRPKSAVKLPYDCLAMIMDRAGLKPATFQAVTRCLGFNDEDRIALLHNRCSPLRVFAALVDDPQEMLGVMADSNIWLTGSRAVSYFYPGVAMADSDWNFRGHSQWCSSLRFAAYLATQGVSWSVPDGKRSTLHGKLTRKGRDINIDLRVFGDSLQPMEKSHSSLAQCFISGYAAICMHAQLTVSGRAKAWESRLPDAAGVAQQLLDKYHDRGIDFLRYDDKRGEAHRLPRMIERSLMDSQSVVIPFVRYLKPNLHARARCVALSAVLETLQYRWTDAITQTFCGLLRLERLHEAHTECLFSSIDLQAQRLVAAVRGVEKLTVLKLHRNSGRMEVNGLESVLSRLMDTPRPEIRVTKIDTEMNSSLEALLRSKVPCYLWTFFETCPM